MPPTSLQVGSVTVIPLSDGGFTPKASDFFPAIAAEQWESVKELVNPDGTLSVNFGAWLVGEADRWTLVDTGLGQRNGAAGLLMPALKAAGVSPDDISLVVITHLHLDHIGWNTVDGNDGPEIVFKNARHVVQRVEWEYWSHEKLQADFPVIGLCAMPLDRAGVLDLIDGERALTPSLSALFSPGHTPGHQSVLVSSGDDRALITGDITHSPAQVTHPDWSPAFDLDPVVSTATRTALFDRVEREGMRVCAGHYPYPSLGGIVRVDGSRRWQPL